MAWIGKGLDKLHVSYVRSLAVVMKHKRLTMFMLLLTVIGNVYLYKAVEKGLFPDQDNGILMGQLRADQATSFQSL